jgi:hypothetical protein
MTDWLVPAVEKTGPCESLPCGLWEDMKRRTWKHVWTARLSTLTQFSLIWAGNGSVLPLPSIWVHPLVCLLPKFMSARTRSDSRLGQPTGDAVRSSGRSRLLVPQAQNNNRRFFFHSGLYRNCSTGEEHRFHHHGDERGSCGTRHGGLYDKATTEESSHQLGCRAATHCGAACL